MTNLLQARNRTDHHPGELLVRRPFLQVHPQRFAAHPSASHGGRGRGHLRRARSRRALRSPSSLSVLSFLSLSLTHFGFLTILEYVTPHYSHISHRHFFFRRCSGSELQRWRLTRGGEGGGREGVPSSPRGLLMRGPPRGRACASIPIRRG